jgi:hypothetical protein
MPFLGIGGLHVIVAIYFAIHVIRQGREMYWLFILFAFPLLGSIVYFFAIYLPSIRHHRHTRTAQRMIQQVVDPGRELRDARHAFDLTPTGNNRARLAAALLATGSAAEAIEHYKACLSGPFANDPKFLTGYAEACLAGGRYEECRQALERLFAEHADLRRQPQPALLYARSLAALSTPAAREAFENALDNANDAEPKSRYAEWLQQQPGADDQLRARQLYEEIIRDSRHWHRHAKQVNKEWLRKAQAAVGS